MKSITQLAATFAYQSYFSTPLLQNAILPQTNGNPIVDSTRQHAQNSGRAVALHPTSQSPVAISFKGGNVDSAVVHLTPGQKITVGDFTQFEWGLPFGWLGGGSVILYVLANEADVEFPQANMPVIIHRLRVRIANGNSVAAPGTPNWPSAFPWSFANRQVGANLTPQQAAPLFHTVPDVAYLQYTGAVAAGPIDLNMQITNEDDFDLQSPPDQAVGYSNGIHFWPVTFPQVVGPNVAQVVWLPQEIARLAGDAASVVFLDPASVLGDTAFVDVVRYGRFM